MFDNTAFCENATQFRSFAGGYEALGLDAKQGVDWANRGFMPSEVIVWLAEGHTPERAAFWANQYTVSPADARERDSR